MSLDPPPRPSPLHMPARRTIPPAPSAPPATRHAFKTPPRRGYLAATTMADTGVLYAAARTRYLLDKMIAHYGSRLRVCDVVLGEVRYRAKSAADASRQLEKNAAAEAERTLDRLAVSVDRLSPEDAPLFDQIVRQLRALKQARTGDGNDAEDHDRHAGEAASIACCVRISNEGLPAVLLTNDGDASLAADARGVPSRHFGHVLNELVCADQLTPEDAHDCFTVAAVVTTPPASCRPRAATDLNCVKAGDNCSACDAATSAVPAPAPSPVP